MNSIRLQNFRSFRDTGTIELRPLTILVGANSSGKSSFLRFFPLMKQTGEAFSGAPLLWNGRYVDFGDISTVMRRGAEDRNIVVELGLPLPIDDIPSAKLALTLGERDRNTVLRKLTFTSGNDTCDLRIDGSQKVEKLLVNGEELAALAADEDQRVPEQIPLESTPSMFLPILLDDRRLLEWAVRQLSPHLVALANSGLPLDIEFKALHSIKYRADPKDFHSDLVGLHDGAAWKQTLARTTPDNRRIEQMRRLTFVGQIPALLIFAARWFSGIARAIGYFLPVRKAPDRFERRQELSVQQLDPSGDNLAMLLLSLSPTERADFSQWAKKSFGFGLNVESTASHVSILIEEGNQSFNLIDMGYGISQVLPVILQCWLATKRPSLVWSRYRTQVAPAITAIEQPELHLHPRLQTNLADLFVGVVNESKTEAALSRRVAPARLLIETHSEPLISRLGELVSEGKLDRKDCSVLRFHKDDKGVTQVHTTGFDEDGMLSEWPPGFLSA